MDDKWKIELYESARGKKIVEEFFDSLEVKTMLKIKHAIELLETFGLEGGYPHIKKLTGSSLWEYRILGSDNIRIFYVSMTEKTFLILHGFKKKKQKTPTKEIKIAEERLKEYLMRKMKSKWPLTVSQICDNISIMTNWDELKQKWLKDPEFKKLYEESQPEFEIAKAIIRARIENKITQKELAKKMHTTQSVISRVEQGKTSPSISLLKRLAAALNTTLQVQFK